MNSWLLSTKTLVMLTMLVAQPTPLATASCLANPPEAQWGQSNTFTLVFDKLCTTPPGMTGFSMCTRAYNGALLGPTLRMRRGETYVLTLVNNLGPEHPDDATLPNNTFRHLNSTNLHTHGLHVSGLLPGDSIFPRIFPEGDNRTYEYRIPATHFQGIHWYHAHLHGATTLQVGGGALGVIIVEDEQHDGLNGLNAMPETILQIHFMDLGLLQIFHPRDEVISFSGSPSSFHLVNGEYQPTICIEQNKWHRLRISHADFLANMVLELGASIFNCRIYLYAKDGVPVKDAPRRLLTNKLFFSMPSRAEIAISCMDVGTYQINATRYVPQNRQFPEIVTGPSVIGFLSVTATNYSAPGVLDPVHPNLPFYLSDLTLAQPAGHWWTNYTNTGTNCSSGKTFCIEIVRPTANSATLNSVQFNAIHMETLKEGSFNQWKSLTARSHPVHAHVNHMQVAEILDLAVGETGFSPNWTQTGDWVDTMAFNGMVRFQANLFGGDLIIHCHMLVHEDEGAMAVLKIEGGCDATCQDVGGIYADPSNRCFCFHCGGGFFYP